MTIKTNQIKAFFFIALMTGLVACNNTQSNKSESTTTDSTTTEKSSASTDQVGLNTDPSTLDTTTTKAANVECLSNWRGCGWQGATQATYNVRPDGTWEFKVFYCCGYGSCYKSGSGASTSRGSVSHEEYSFNASVNCLVLVNRQYW